MWLCKIIGHDGHQVHLGVFKDCWMEAQLPTDIDIHRWLTERKPTLYANKEEEEIFREEDKFSIHKQCQQLHVHWDDKVNLRGIPIVLVSEIVKCFNPHPGKSPCRQINDSTDNILRRLNAPNLMMQPRIHIHVIYKTIGASLTWFSCRCEFVKVIMGAAVGLFNGTHKHVLQCDASDSNVLIIVDGLEPKQVVPDWLRTGYTHRGGMLGDWGYAKDQDVNRTFPRQKGNMMGTFPFTAAEFLSDDDQKNDQGTHEIHHDLESLFWIMWIAAVNLEGPFNQRREWQSTNTETAEPFAGNIRKPVVPSPNIDGVPAWATPGLHTCSRTEVYEWKRTIPSITFKSSMCAYWTDNTSGATFPGGMDKLAKYFRHTEHQDPVTKKFVVGPPSKRITPTKFLRILHNMHEAIPPEEDCPTNEQIQDGRARYQKLLEKQMGLQASILDPFGLIRSQSNRGSACQSTANMVIASAEQSCSKRPPEEPAPVTPSKPSKRPCLDLPQVSSGTGRAEPAKPHHSSSLHSVPVSCKNPTSVIRSMRGKTRQ
ncbi:hypothetical protein OG21DRAFT_360520 [Imleria badia]|nr:hypothetical protein OG21DRAFT_360520 [Imleria badia]